MSPYHSCHAAETGHVGGLLLAPLDTTAQLQRWQLRPKTILLQHFCVLSVLMLRWYQRERCILRPPRPGVSLFQQLLCMLLLLILPPLPLLLPVLLLLHCCCYDAATTIVTAVTSIVSGPLHMCMKGAVTWLQG
jgi:hypothetical protein